MLLFFRTVHLRSNFPSNLQINIDIFGLIPWDIICLYLSYKYPNINIYPVHPSFIYIYTAYCPFTIVQYHSLICRVVRLKHVSYLGFLMCCLQNSKQNSFFMYRNVTLCRFACTKQFVNFIETFLCNPLTLFHILCG